MDWAATIGADEVVVPDVQRDYRRTVERARDFARHARAGYRYMGVVQGSNTAELLACYNAFDALPYITTIGFPRNIGNEFPTARVALLDSLYSTGWFADHRPVDIHCLGSIPTFVKEVGALATVPDLRSIDTSTPAVYAIQLRNIESGYLKLRREPTFFDEDLTSGQEAMYATNIRTYFDWARYTSPYAPPSPSTVRGVLAE